MKGMVSVSDYHAREASKLNLVYGMASESRTVAGVFIYLVMF